MAGVAADESLDPTGGTMPTAPAVGSGAAWRIVAVPAGTGLSAAEMGAFRVGTSPAPRRRLDGGLLA